MSKHLFSLLPVMAIALAGGRDSVAPWTEVRTPHFSLVSDADEKQGRQIALQFERMREVFRNVYPQLEEDPESPITILAIRDSKIFRTLEPSAYLKKGSLEMRGLFVRGSERSYILMRLDAAGGNPFPVAFHEYTHLLLEQTNNSIPLWLNEGLAEFYANSEIRGPEVLLAQPNPRHLQVLRSGRFLPLTTLFTIDRKSPYYIEKDKGSIFYAESWALTHYLTLKDREEKSSRVEQYTKLLSAKQDPVTAGVEVFGNLKKLQKELEAYIQRPNLDQFKMNVIPHLDESNFDVEPITAVQMEAVEADFLANSGRPEQAHALIQRVMKEDPDNALAQETIALLDSANEDTAEKNLREAVRQDPTSAVASHRLASFLWARGTDLDEARKLESEAVSLDSANLDYRFTLANILLSMGFVQSANEVLRGAALIAKSPEETQEVERRLADAATFALTRTPEKTQRQEKETESLPDNEQVAHRFIPRGPPLFLVGTLKQVHCSPPALDLTVTSRAKTLTLHAENYYKVQFTALFSPTVDLKPCEDLENRLAKVEYVESANKSDVPHLIAIELHK